MARLIITIDGPAGCGKSTAAKSLAAKIGATFLDTGAMYRALTLAAMRAKIDLTDIKAIEDLIDKTDFKFEVRDNKMIVKIDGEDVTEQIRTPQVANNVHFIASQPTIRSRLVKMQRAFAENCEKIVTEGRDQGTVVFPNANYKFFLTADLMERTKRRAAEFAQKGIKVDVDKLYHEIEARDSRDRNRSVSPLKPAEDAIIIDNTNFTPEQTLNEILKYIKDN